MGKKKKVLKQYITNIHPPQQRTAFQRICTVVVFLAALGGAALLVYWQFPQAIKWHKEQSESEMLPDNIFLTIPYEHYAIPLGFREDPMLTPYELIPNGYKKIQFDLVQNKEIKHSVHTY